MDATSLVVAFADSPTLRETLAVLLECDCSLRFVDTALTVPSGHPIPDLAVVAVPQPTKVLPTISCRWPSVPIVAIDLSALQPAAPLRTTPATVQLVPLEPQAIRAAVLRQLQPPCYAVPASTVALIAQTLRDELGYSLTALRAFSALHAASPGADTYAILGAMMREQAHVLGRAIAQLDLFRERPRDVGLSADFVGALCRQLEQPDHAGDDRAMLCECTVETALRVVAGPVCLVPLLAHLIRAHLLRRSSASVVTVRGKGDSVAMRYQPHESPLPTAASWPLLLAALALRPWNWRVWTATSGGEETVELQSGT